AGPPRALLPGTTRRMTMKKLALITAFLIAGSSAAALADRDHDRRGDRYNNGDRDRYDRFGDTRWSREYSGRWTTLGSRYAASSKTNQIFVNNGRFDKIRVEADRGTPVITKVTIEYNNAAPQYVPMNSRLSQGNGEVIRLNSNRPIKRVIVYTEPRSGGHFSVYGA
ncbi:MAG: hypothetical protein ABI867_38545, partial [Kofleriaceae bacterium]